eukprot:scaffold62876_cov20-Tisochrysis_lutea.AAC.7
MVPLLKFWFHEEVRRAAVQTLPELVRSAALCVEKGNLNGVDANVLKQVRYISSSGGECVEGAGTVRTRALVMSPAVLCVEIHALKRVDKDNNDEASVLLCCSLGCAKLSTCPRKALCAAKVGKQLCNSHTASPVWHVIPFVNPLVYFPVSISWSQWALHEQQMCRRWTSSVVFAGADALACTPVIIFYIYILVPCLLAVLLVDSMWPAMVDALICHLSASPALSSYLLLYLMITRVPCLLALQLVDYVWPAMMDALGKEPDADVQGTMMESICEIVELVGVNKRNP